jgi:hypothetical protein
MSPLDDNILLKRAALRVAVAFMSHLLIPRANHCSHCREGLCPGGDSYGGNGRAPQRIRRSDRFDATEMAVLAFREFAPSRIRIALNRRTGRAERTLFTFLQGQDSRRNPRHRFISSPSARHPNKKELPACGKADASEPLAAVSIPQESRWFAPLDATVSLHSCPRGQASSGQHWRGAGNIGR